MQRDRVRGAWGAARDSRGRNRQARHHSALGSARETLACLEVAVVSSHINQDCAVHDQLDRVIGTLVKLVAK